MEANPDRAVLAARGPLPPSSCPCGIHTFRTHWFWVNSAANGATLTFVSASRALFARLRLGVGGFRYKLSNRGCLLPVKQVVIRAADRMTQGARQPGGTRRHQPSKPSGEDNARKLNGNSARNNFRKDACCERGTSTFGPNSVSDRPGPLDSSPLLFECHELKFSNHIRGMSVRSLWIYRRV